MITKYIEQELVTNYSSCHYQSTKQYDKGDIVEHKGSLYQCLVASVEEDPINSTYWRVIA